MFDAVFAIRVANSAFDVTAAIVARSDASGLASSASTRASSMKLL